MAAISSSHRSLDPVTYFQYHPTIVSKILLSLPKISDLQPCMLVSRKWGEANPRKILIKAIETNRLDVVLGLLKQGLSPKFRIAGTKFVTRAENTPYLLAKSLHRDDIASALKEKDGTFSEEMVKKKLDCLRFELADYPFSIQGQLFQKSGTQGVGHEFHHEHLLPDLIRSLQDFFAQKADTPHWNQTKSKQLIKALQRSKELCPSCSPRAFKEKVIASDELVIFSDTSIFNHMHWVTYAVKNSHYGLGNRGGGCAKHPGARIYKKDLRGQKLLPNDLSTWNKLDPSLCAQYLKSAYQRSPCCSRASAEEGVLAAIGVILRDEYEAQGRQLSEQESKELNDNALSIIQEWINFDHELSLKNIMNDEKIVHDQGLYVRFLASLKTTSQVAENFYYFLSSKGPIDWFGKDVNHRIPCDYVPKKYYLYNEIGLKNYLNLDSLIDRVVCKAKTQFNPEDVWFWNQIELFKKHGLMRGFDVQNRIFTAYASLESCSPEDRMVAGGLLKLSYKPKSKACSLNVIIPAEDRRKLVNVFICFLNAWYSHKIKFSSKTTEFVPNKDFISFDVQFISPFLCNEFINDFRDIYKTSDASKKYSHGPVMGSVIKKVKQIDAEHRGQSYVHLCEFINNLVPST